MTKRVIMLRTTSIVDDSRITKEANALLKNGYQVTIYGWDRSQKIKGNILKLENGEIHLDYCSIPCSYGGGIKNILKILQFFRQLKKYLKQNHKNYDIIHSCDLDTGIIARKIARKYQKKLVYDIFDYYTDSHSFPKPISTILEGIEVKTINHADVTILCTEQRKEQICKAHPKKIITIHNTPNIPANLKDIDFKIKGKSKNIKVVYVGVLQDHRLLKEISEQVKDHDNIELHIGGFGIYENYFKQMDKKYDNIYFYGSMEYKNVLKLESQADILFATYDPSILNHKYSAPNKVYEAMALGKPIIVCKNTGVDKIVEEHHFGLTIAYNGQDFIKAVLEIQKINYKPNEIKKAYALFHWDTMETRLVEAYEKL